MKKRMLQKPERDLVEMIQRVNFGQVTVAVSCGQPDWSKGYRIVRTAKFKGEKPGPRPEATSRDFELRGEHVWLLDVLASTSDGALLTIEVQRGLPVFASSEEKHWAA